MEMASQSLATQLTTSPLVKLPLELTLAITSHLSTNDLHQLRLVCKHLDDSISETLAIRNFRRIDLLPTEAALARLLELAKNVKLRSHVKELSIHASIFWDYSDGESAIVRYNRCNRPSTWGPVSGDRPPILLNEHPADDTLAFMKGGSFQKQLMTTLCSLQIDRVEIRSRHPPEDAWGKRQLNQQRDAHKTRRRRGYISPNLFGFTANTVLAAIAESHAPISSLEIDNVEVNRLQVLQQQQSSPYYIGQVMSRLAKLDIKVLLTPSKRTRIGAKTNESSSHGPILLDADPSSLAIFTFLDSLTSLEDLGIHFLAYGSNLDKIDDNLFRHMCESAQLLQLRTLRLQGFHSPMAGLIPFLARLPRLRVLEFFLATHEIKRGEEPESVAPWKEWLPLLGTGSETSTLSLERLVITMEIGMFVGDGADGINAIIAKLLAMPPAEWLLPEPDFEPEDYISRYSIAMADALRSNQPSRTSVLALPSPETVGL